MRNAFLGVISLVVLSLFFSGQIKTDATFKGSCYGDCASEQGICISNCNGDSMCIGNCNAAHGRCVARCGVVNN